MLLINIGRYKVHATTWFYEFPQPCKFGIIKGAVGGTYEVHLFSLYLVISRTCEGGGG